MLVALYAGHVTVRPVSVGGMVGVTVGRVGLRVGAVVGREGLGVGGLLIGWVTVGAKLGLGTGATEGPPGAE